MFKTTAENLSAVSETLLIPLYYRALETQRPDAMIKDEKALELIKRLSSEGLIHYDSNWLKQTPMSKTNKVLRIMLTRQTDPDVDRIALIQEAYDASHQTYGYRRIQIWIQQNRGVIINHKAVLRLMNKMGIRSVARKRKIYRKLDGYKSFHLYSNVLNRDFTASRPNQKWVTDITYIQTQQGWAYLSTIKDLFDGFIVAHYLDRNQSVSLVTKTIKQALQKEKVTAGLILHSNQGQQYSSHPYHVLTNQYDMTQSMSRRGNVWDNAPMENFFGHLKEEAIRRIKNPTFNQVKQIVDEYIYFYNYERIQLKTKQTPYQIRCLSG